MNLKILNTVKNLQVKLVEKQNIWASRGRWLYLSNNNGKDWKKQFVLKMNLMKTACTHAKLTRRLLCLDVQILIELQNSIKVVFSGSGIYCLNKGNRVSCRVHTFQNGRRLLTNGATKDIEGNIYFGEYFSNKERNEVRIFKSEDGGIHWNPVYTFAKGSIRHIHAVQFDSHKNMLWVATGDNKEEAKIAYSKDKGKGFTFIGEGSPKWKAVSLVFTKNYVYWGTDNPRGDNYIYRWNRKNKLVEEIAYIRGPIYSSKRVGDYLLFSTGVEKEKDYKNKYARIYCVDKKLNCHELYRLRKDIWKPVLFGYGLLEFVSGSCTENNFWVNTKNLTGGERSILFHIGD